MRMFDKSVEVNADFRSGTGAVMLNAGDQGQVVWVEPDDDRGDVIVRFKKEVTQANGGLLLNPCEAWVPRHLLKIISN